MKTKIKAPVKELKVAKIRVSESSRSLVSIEKARRGGSMIDAADRLIAAGYKKAFLNNPLK